MRWIPQAASLGGDAYQRLQHVGVLPGQRGELVNRYHQVRDDHLRRKRNDVLGAVFGQDPLAPVHLGLQ